MSSWSRCHAEPKNARDDMYRTCGDARAHHTPTATLYQGLITLSAISAKKTETHTPSSASDAHSGSTGRPKRGMSSPGVSHCES